MHRRSKVSNRIVRSLLPSVAVCFSISLLGIPANAHKTEVSGNVAGTWHVEPNHSPKAGQPAQVWVALTQQGGKIIPLAECDCQLKIYQTSGAKIKPVLKPSLQATSVENYQGIPGATVTFPQVGEYQLKLTGRPKTGANFQAFDLNYTVTVAMGSPATRSAPAPQASTSPPTNHLAPNPQVGETTTATPPFGVLGKSLIGLSAIVFLLVILRVARQRSTKTED